MLKDRQRKKIIGIYREMNYNVYDPATGANKADMAKIEESLVKHWGKLLNEYSMQELSKIIGVLENKFLPYFYKQLQK